MNTSLRIAFIEEDRKIYEVERDADLPQSKLSKIIHQIVEPTDGEKDRIAKILKRPTSDLFTSPSTPVNA